MNILRKNKIRKAPDHQNSIRKKHATMIVPVIIISGMIGFFYWQGSDQRSFTRLSREIFTDGLAANTLNMHYTVAYPEDFDIAYLPGLPVYSAEQSAQHQNDQDGLLARLNKIAPAHLSDADAYAYQLLMTRLLNQQTGDRLYLYDEPLSPASGIQSSLPVLLADYAFRSGQDVTDYLAVLDQIDDFLAGMVAFEQEKSAAGLFMSEAIADKTIEQLDRIMDRELLLAGNHFLQSTFRERLEPLANSGEINAAARDLLIEENNRLLLTVVEPAYQKTADEIFLLKDYGTNDMGMAYYPEGQNYYRYLLKKDTGSYRSIDEIKQLLYQNFQENYNELIRLTAEYPRLIDEIHGDSLLLPLEDPTAILNHLQEKIGDNYPAIPTAADKQSPICTVKNVSASMEPYSSPAYYLTPPIDSYRENSIYINQRSNTDLLSLYTTLAHEGYPGHLYQTIYHHSYMDQSHGNPLRYVLHYGGYLEGWAFYTEMDSFRYAKQLMAETVPAAAYVYDYYRLSSTLQLCLYSLIDIAINYDGADQTQIGKILAVIGIRDEAVVRSIYENIIADPVNYPKYYLGYLEILELKKEAMRLWQDDYNDYRFHQFFLEAGPSDFYNLNRLLQSTVG